MKKDVPLWQFAGFAFTALGGTLLHYLYEWTGKSVWVAPFSGVNESTDTAPSNEDTPKGTSK